MFTGLMLIAMSLAGQASQAASDDLKEEVRRLVRQLDSDELAQRNAAEEALIGKGPGRAGVAAGGDRSPIGRGPRAPCPHPAKTATSRGRVFGKTFAYYAGRRCHAAFQDTGGTGGAVGQ